VLSGRKLGSTLVQNLQHEILGHPGAVQIMAKSGDTSALFEALNGYCGFEAAIDPADRSDISLH